MVTDIRVGEFTTDGGDRRRDVLVISNRNHDREVGRDAWRHHEAVVIAVGHEKPAEEARRGAPAGRVGVVAAPTVGLELNVEGLCEVLAQLVARRHLESLAIFHHAFESHGVGGASETLGRRLDPDVGGHGHVRANELVVDLEVDAASECGRVGVGRVCRVSLLPQELARAQKHPRSHLPAHHIGPLIEQQR